MAIALPPKHGSAGVIKFGWTSSLSIFRQQRKRSASKVGPRSKLVLMKLRSTAQPPGTRKGNGSVRLSLWTGATSTQALPAVTPGGALLFAKGALSRRGFPNEEP